MAIVRRYFDEENWEVVDEQVVRKVFANYFVDVDLAMVDLEAHCVVTTSAAEYKRSSEPTTASPAGE